MPAPLLEPPVQRWECVHCNAKDVTRELAPHTRFHTCPGLGGITAPMTEESKRGKQRVRAVVREDFEGADAGKTQKNDDGVPIMSVVTEHDDGRVDCAVMAPCVTGKGEASR